MKPRPAYLLFCLLSAPCLPALSRAEGAAPAAQAPGKAGEESPYEKNRALMERGEYRAALLGFADMVIANPEDAQARENLKLAGERVMKREREAALGEKRKFMDEANDSRRLIMTLRAAKERRSAPWRDALARASSLAGSLTTVKAGVLAYEQWLEATPIFSDNKREFLTGLKRVTDAFYATIKSRYPYLVQGRTTVDSRDLASLTFSEESLNEDTSHYVETNQTQKVLEKADKLRRIEREILRHYDIVEKATELYSRMHYAESMAGFRDVLVFDAFNEEALFFLDQAQKRSGLPADGAELKQ